MLIYRPEAIVNAKVLYTLLFHLKIQRMKMMYFRKRKDTILEIRTGLNRILKLKILIQTDCIE